jgi:hypothetical protein
MQEQRMVLPLGSTLSAQNLKIGSYPAPIPYLSHFHNLLSISPLRLGLQVVSFFEVS